MHYKIISIRLQVLISAFEAEEHPDTVTSYHNLALLYKSQGKYEISLIYYYKAYKIFASKLRINHPNTQIVYDNMKITYFKWNPEGDFKKWLEEKLK